MTIATETRTATARPAPFATAPRTSILAALAAWLLDADRRYREARRFERLDADARRDMGLTRAEQRQTADRRFLTGQW